MPLNLVIGYPDRGFNPEAAKVLYIGGDGVKAKAILHKENEKFPVREGYLRPLANRGRRIDLSARAEDTYVPDLGLNVETSEKPSDEAPVVSDEAPAVSDTASEK